MGQEERGGEEKERQKEKEKVTTSQGPLGRTEREGQEEKEQKEEARPRYHRFWLRWARWRKRGSHERVRGSGQHHRKFHRGIFYVIPKYGPSGMKVSEKAGLGIGAAGKAGFASPGRVEAGGSGQCVYEWRQALYLRRNRIAGRFWPIVWTHARDLPSGPRSGPTQVREGRRSLRRYGSKNDGAPPKSHRWSLAICETSGDPHTRDHERSRKRDHPSCPEAHTIDGEGKGQRTRSLRLHHRQKLGALERERRKRREGGLPLSEGERQRKKGRPQGRPEREREVAELELVRHAINSKACGLESQGRVSAAREPSAEWLAIEDEILSMVSEAARPATPEENSLSSKLQCTKDGVSHAPSFQRQQTPEDRNHAPVFERQQISEARGSTPVFQSFTTSSQEGQASEGEERPTCLFDLADEGMNLAGIGVGITWLIFIEGRLSKSSVCVLRRLQTVIKADGWHARASRGMSTLFPFPFCWEALIGELSEVSWFEVRNRDWKGSELSCKAWVFLSVLFCGLLWRRSGLFRKGSLSRPQQLCLDEVERGVRRFLKSDRDVHWSVEDIKEEIGSRDLSYTGEELSRPEELTLEQMLLALPPPSHGGKIPLLDWVSERTRQELLHPDLLLLDPRERERIPLQARVHIAPDDRRLVAQELIARGVCTLVEETQCLTFDGQQVLSGMLGVKKAATVESGKPVLRCIMNLIPANSCHRIMKGSIDELPSICQWLSMHIGESEEVVLSQSDMSAAFYLFRLPELWQRRLCFNLRFEGSQFADVPHVCPHRRNYLASAVLPMGWASAVGIMQEVSSNLLLRDRLPSYNQICKRKPLPRWMCEILEGAGNANKSFWHVYLDNFCCGAKIKKGEADVAGRALHEEAEAAWSESGVLSSAKKQVKSAYEVVELGAMINGREKWIGCSPERIVKVIKFTLWLCVKARISRKQLYTDGIRALD